MYDVVQGWEQLPAGFSHPDVAAVAVDHSGRVYLFCRAEHPVLVYERDGRFVRSWGEGLFTMRAHGITVAPDGSVWCVDDGDQTARKFDPDGRLLLTLGTSGRASDTGYDGTTVASIARGGPPFNRPTNLAVAPNGELYVTDGYGNARVHRFSSKGELVGSWGEPGTGPGQFMLPHGIAVHRDGRVFVADRENDRIQIFSPDGEFLGEWDVQRPTQLVFDANGNAIVAELPCRALDVVPNCRSHQPPVGRDPRLQWAFRARPARARSIRSGERPIRAAPQFCAQQVRDRPNGTFTSRVRGQRSEPGLVHPTATLCSSRSR